MNSICINEKLYSDLLITGDKSVAQVICDTEILKEIYALLRQYIMGIDTYPNLVKMKYYSRLTEQVREVTEGNRQAKELYKWLFGKDFRKSDEHGLTYLKSESRLLEELRTLVKSWDEDETDGDLVTEAIIAAFRFTRNISSTAS